LNLADLPVVVPEIFADKLGEPFAEDEDNIYTLMSRVPGQQRFNAWYESQLFTEADIKQGFQILGELHNAYQKINITDRKNEPNVLELLDRFEIKFGETEIVGNLMAELIQKEKKYITFRIKQIRKNLEAESYKQLPLFPTHHDINYTNVLWEGEKIVSLIDFDWARFSTLEFDFAQMCKLTCGSFSMTGNSNLFDKKRLETALAAYNERSNYKIENKKLLANLLDVSSLFLAYWAVDTYSKERTKEEYYLSFFQAGIDRLHQEIIL
jgi:Ser/Thr protein kinase RdoA (MazF antagonist)